MTGRSLVEASQIAEDIEVRAWSSLTAAVRPEMAMALGLTMHRSGAFSVGTCRAFDDFVGNRAFGIAAGTPCSLLAMNEVVAHFRALRLRNYALQINPWSQPGRIGDWLARHRLEKRNRWAVMVRGTAATRPVASPYTVRRDQPAGSVEFARTVGTAFGWPAQRASWMTAAYGRRGWHHYTAYDSAAPIAVGAMFVDGHAAWLGMGGTVAAYRHRGAHTLLLTRRIEDALDLGCRWVVAETGEANPSLKHLRGTGFDLLYWRDNFCPRPGAIDKARSMVHRAVGAVAGRLRRS